MAETITIDRQWIAAELINGIDQERTLAREANARAESPPDASLTVLYHEIAQADERHAVILEKIAARYGHTPSESTEGGIGGMFQKLKVQVGEFGSGPHDQVWSDLTAKARWIQWLTAWAQAFQTLGDLAGGREIETILDEEKTHRDALQNSLNRLVVRRASTDKKDAK
jgi:hypothetical protein